MTNCTIIRYECITCKAKFKPEEKEKIQRHDSDFHHVVMPVFKEKLEAEK